MPKQRDGFQARLIEMPADKWAKLDELKERTGLGVQHLLEVATDMLYAKPPKKLPEPRKRGPKKKEPAAE